MFFGRVVNVGSTQGTGYEFIGNLGVLRRLLFVLFSLLPWLLQAAFHAPRFMRRSCPPQPPEEVIKGADTWRIVRLEAAENRIDG